MNASTNHPARASAARTVTIDLAKEAFELAFADAEHRIVARKRLAHGSFVRCFHDRLQLRVAVQASLGASAGASPLLRGLHDG